MCSVVALGRGAGCARRSPQHKGWALQLARWMKGRLRVGDVGVVWRGAAMPLRLHGSSIQGEESPQTKRQQRSVLAWLSPVWRCCPPTLSKKVRCLRLRRPWRMPRNYRRLPPRTGSRRSVASPRPASEHKGSTTVPGVPTFPGVPRRRSASPRRRSVLSPSRHFPWQPSARARVTGPGTFLCPLSTRHAHAGTWRRCDRLRAQWCADDTEGLRWPLIALAQGRSKLSARRNRTVRSARTGSVGNRNAILAFSAGRTRGPGGGCR